MGREDADHLTDDAWDADAFGGDGAPMITWTIFEPTVGPAVPLEELHPDEVAAAEAVAADPQNRPPGT